MINDYITEKTYNPYEEEESGTKNVHEVKQMKKEQTEQKKKPEQKFRAGSVTATIWAKDIEVTRDGKKTSVTVYNTEIVKNYKDGEEWKKTNNFGKDDLVKLQVVLAKATEFLYLNEDSE